VPVGRLGRLGRFHVPPGKKLRADARATGRAIGTRRPIGPPSPAVTPDPRPEKSALYIGAFLQPLRPWSRWSPWSTHFAKSAVPKTPGPRGPRDHGPKISPTGGVSGDSVVLENYGGPRIPGPRAPIPGTTKTTEDHGSGFRDHGQGCGAPVHRSWSGREITALATLHSGAHPQNDWTWGHKFPAQSAQSAPRRRPPWAGCADCAGFWRPPAPRVATRAPHVAPSGPAPPGPPSRRPRDTGERGRAGGAAGPPAP